MAECLLTTPEVDRVGVRVTEDHRHPAPLTGLARQQPVEVRPQLVEEYGCVHEDADPLSWLLERARRFQGRVGTVAFRPIIAPTEAQTWEKARDIVARIEDRVRASVGH